MLKRLLALLFFASAFSSVFSSNIAAPDTSLKQLTKLYELKAYYINQAAKEHISPALKQEYNNKVESVDKDIQQYYINKRNLIVQSGNKAELEKFRRDSTQREDDLALSRENKPAVYAYEVGSHLFGMYVSLLTPQKKYSPPVSIFYEKSLTKNISVGGFISHFIEKDIISLPMQRDNKYFKLSTENYKYKYWILGLKGSYHFVNPEAPLFGLNPMNWDLYVTALAGFSMASDVKPVLENGMYLLPPTKDGINAGAFAGARYMYDERLGFFAEAGFANTSFVNIGVNYKFFKINKPAFMKKKEKKKSSSNSKSGKEKTPAKSTSKTPSKTPVKKAPAKAPVKKAPVKKK